MEKINGNQLRAYRKTMIFRGILVWVPSILSAVSMLLFRFAWSPFPQRPLSDFGGGFQAGMVLKSLKGRFLPLDGRFSWCFRLLC